MTKRHHKKAKPLAVVYAAALFAPKTVYADNRYGVHALDNSAEEIMPGGAALNGTAAFHSARDESGSPVFQRRREAAVDDPYLSPMKSEAIRALLVLIEFAQAHTYYTGHAPDEELDVEGFCRDAGLTPLQLEVALMIAEGWGVGAIATRLGISHQAVSLRLHYGRRKLVRQVLPVDIMAPKHLRGVYCGGDETRLRAV